MSEQLPRRAVGTRSGTTSGANDADRSSAPSRRSLLRGTAAAGGLGILVPGLAGCVSAGGAHRGDPQSVSFGIASYPGSLDPYVDNGQDTRNVNMALHRGLFVYDVRGKLVESLLRQHRQIDARSYEFVLREGLTFHDGSPVTAEDLEASLLHMANEKSGAKLVEQMSSIDEIETTGRHSCVVTLKEPDATFLQALGDPQAPILPAAVLENGDTHKQWTGAGPYRLTGRNRGVGISVRSFDGYHVDARPRTNAITFRVFEDDRMRLTALQTGELDIISYPAREDAKRIEADPDLIYDAVEGPFQYLTFNCTKGPFADRRVRQAVGYAVDRDAVCRAALFDQGIPLTGIPVPRISELYDKRIARHWTHDPDRARRLLREAGYSNGFTATMLSSSQYTFHRDTALVVQANLEKIGIRLRLDLPDWATRIDKGDAGEYDISVQGSSGYFNDPAALDKFLRGPASYVRSFGFDDDTINELLDKGQASSNTEKRRRIYATLIERALDQAPIIGLAWRMEAFAYRRSLRGFHSLPGFLQFNSAYTLENMRIMH